MSLLQISGEINWLKKASNVSSQQTHVGDHTGSAVTDMARRTVLNAFGLAS